MPLLRRRGPGRPRPGLAAGTPGGLVDCDDLDGTVSASQRRRRQAMRALIALAVVIPAASLVAGQGFTGRVIFLFPATGVFVYLLDRTAIAPLPTAGWRRRWQPGLVASLVALGIALFAVGGMSWLTGLAIAAAALGRFVPAARLAMLGVAACAALGLAVTAALHLGYGNMISAALVPTLGGVLARSADRRNALIDRLRETRAELARAAVAEERLRIARDLHDLLGHSLSLIALKAELAGRLIGQDPARAAREIADLETVARRSLTEVRQAVTSYRQPGLAAELAAARRMLASAGIDCRVEVPGSYSFPPAVDALLAWTVREGTTNIVRHSGARHASIHIEVSGDLVATELTDDGGSPCPDGAGDPAHGSGLAGLAERAGRLGGTLVAAAGGRDGFRLRVSVPLAAAGGGQDEVPALAEERSA